MMKVIRISIVSWLFLALVVLGAHGAHAQTPPSAQTLKPTEMYVYYAGTGAVGGGWTTEDVRATLNATVNPNGSNCSVYFEYGTTAQRD